jgi:DNA polymerase III subunit beta
MDIHVKRDVLLAAVERTLGIVERKTTMPILNNLLLRAADDHIVIIATDMEASLTANYEAQVVQKGEVTLPARKLYEMVKGMQEETTHLFMENNLSVVLECGKVRYKIVGMPADDFPDIEERVGFPLYPVKCSTLHELLKKTYFSIANDDLRVSLKGALLETEKSDDSYVIRMVSTDGSRLSLASALVAGQEFFLTSPDTSAIIPKKGMAEIMRLLEVDKIDEVTIGLGPGVIVVKAGDVLLKERLIDSTYPDYRRVIPTESGIKVTLNRNQFLHAIRRMLVIAGDAKRVRTSLSAGKVVLNSTNDDVGEAANDEIETQYEGEDVSIEYNPKHIEDVIKIIDEDEIDLNINANSKPTVIQGNGNPDYLYLVMPLVFS